MRKLTQSSIKRLTVLMYPNTCLIFDQLERAIATVAREEIVSTSMPRKVHSHKRKFATIATPIAAVVISVNNIALSAAGKPFSETALHNMQVDPGLSDADFVALTYRRGLENVTFMTLRKGTGEWTTDPLYADGDGSFGKARNTLNAGAFSGTTVTVETFLSSQHLWGARDSFVLAIAGDLTQAEMIEAANSLHNQVLATVNSSGVLLDLTTIATMRVLGLNRSYVH